MLNWNHKVSVAVTKELLGTNYSENDLRTAKVCYGFENIIAELQKDFVLFLVFTILDFGTEFVFCFCVVNVTRVYLGGLHMKTSLGCMMVSVLIYGTAILCGTIFPVPTYCQMLLWFVCVVVMILYAPFPSPQRPKYSKAKRDIFKRKGVFGLLLVALLVVVYRKYAHYMMWILLLQLFETVIVIIKKEGGEVR